MCRQLVYRLSYGYLAPQIDFVIGAFSNGLTSMLANGQCKQDFSLANIKLLKE